MHGIIPKLFDFWANPVAHLLLLKSSMVQSVNHLVHFKQFINEASGRFLLRQPIDQKEPVGCPHLHRSRSGHQQSYLSETRVSRKLPKKQNKNKN